MRPFLLFYSIGLVASAWISPAIASHHKPEQPVPVSIGNEADWVTPDDYPSAALRDERQGITATELKVDRTGRVSACRIVRSSGHSDLDAAACSALTARAQFVPARDDRGVAVVGFFLKRVRWQIPDVPRSPSGNSGW